MPILSIFKEPHKESSAPTQEQHPNEWSQPLSWTRPQGQPNINPRPNCYDCGTNPRQQEHHEGQAQKNVGVLVNRLKRRQSSQTRRRCLMNQKRRAWDLMV